MQEVVVNPKEKDGKQGMKHKKVDPLLLNHEGEVLKNNKIKQGAHYLLNHKRRSPKIKKSPLLFKPWGGGPQKY